MNSLVENLNIWGSRLADISFRMFIQSSVVIVLLFVLDVVMRQRVRAVFRYGLWMLVLIKLLLPPSLALPTGLAYWLPQEKTVETHTLAPSRFVVHYGAAKFDQIPVFPALPPPRPTLRFTGFLVLGWLTVSVGLMAWLARRSRRIATSTRQAIPAPDTPGQLLDICRRQMRIGRRIRLRLGTTVSSPAVYGLLRPVILIPQRLADKLSALQLRAVLLHELAHIKRGDVLVHYAQTLLQILYWWQPLLWFANARIRHVREQAVDEMVMVEMGVEAEAYPATLLTVAKLTFQRPMLSLGLIGIVESKSILAQRVQRLLERPVPKSAKLGFARLAAVALIGAALLPMARGQRPAAQPAPGVNARPVIVSIAVKFVELTDPALEAVSLGSPTVTGPNGHRAWVLPPEDDLIARLQGQADTRILYAPSVTTHSGQQAQISDTQSQDFNGNVIEVGPICDLLPVVSGDWLDLTVSAKVTEFGEIVSDQLNGLQLRPKQSDNSAKSERGAVYSVNATGYVVHDAGTARVSVVDAGFAVLQNPEVKSINGNRILVVVSPRIIRETASASTPDPNAVSLAGSSSPAARPRGETQALPTPTTKSAQAQPAGAMPKRNAAEAVSLIEIGERYWSKSKPSRPGRNVMPTDSAAKDSASERVPENLTVTIAREGPYFYFSYLTLDSKPASLEELQTEFKRVARMNPAVTLSIRADRDAPLGLLVKVADAAKQAGIKSVTLFTVPQTSGTDSLRATNTDGSMERNGAKSAERLLNQPANAGTESQSKPVSDGSVSSSISPRDRMQVLGDLPLFGPAREAIEAKLKQIILPEVIFDNMPLPEALRWLTEQARKHDPDGTGLNFLLNPNVIPAGPEAIIDPTTGQPVTLSSPQPLDMNTVMVRINPPLKNVQLSDALEAIVHTADKPIRYSIEDYAVIFSQNQPGTAHLETRTFHVDPKAFIQRLQNKFPGPTDAQQIRRFLTAIGVDVLPPNMVFFNDRRGTLMLRATSEELRRVQDAIGALGRGGSKETGQGFPTGSPRATVMSAATLEPRNSPGAEAGKSSEAETDLLAWMRTYVCDELASLRLRVKLEADGTYLASSEEDGVRHTETGTWKRKGREFILERTAGDLQYAIRRLRVDERNPTYLLWVPPISNPVGAIEYLSFKPVDETPAASNHTERTETKESTSDKRSANLETRTFRLDPTTFAEDAYRFLIDAGLSDLEIFGHSNDWKASLIRKFCESLGASHVSPNTIFYSDGSGWLMVRATAEELERVQKAIEKFNPEARFVEITQSDIKQLGFDWFLGNTLMSNGRMGVQGGTAPSFGGAPSLANPAGVNRHPLQPQVAKDKASQPNATEEVLVTKTAPFIYLGPQPVTLEVLKRRLVEAKGRNPKLNLVVKADRDAPADQVAGVLETARSLNIEPFTTQSSETIKLETRVFRVSPTTLFEGLKNTAGVPLNSGTVDSIQDSIRKFFTAAGVNVQPPNALFFNHRTGVLMVRATSKELDIVQKALEALNDRPPQITIEAKFMELPAEAAIQLGFELPPPDRASTTWTRILTAAQARAVLHAAERHAGVDILSVPKITTLSGRQAQIQAVEIKTIVNGIAPEALAPPGVQSTNGNPAQPYLTSQIPCGPTLDVTPHVAADGCTIHLTALPQVTEFLRYDTTLIDAYESHFRTSRRQQKVPMPRPIIRHRSMHAAVDVYDGQTLVLANPQVTVVSKQPTGESVTNAVPEDAQKRLFVFITPTMIDPAGNPIHTSGHEPWADRTPPQRP